jgi:hypothetical protein
MTEVMKKLASEYQMTNEEKVECEKIVSILKRLDKSCYLGVGNPIPEIKTLSDDDYCQFLFKMKDGFFLVTVLDKDDFSIEAFDEEWLEEMYKNYTSSLVEALLYHLIDDGDNEIMFCNGYCCEAVVNEDGHCIIKPVHNSNDFANLEFVMVECPSCKRTTCFNISNIPDGVEYEVKCSNCDTLIKRRK